MVTWLDGNSMPVSSGRLLPKPNGDLHVVDSTIEDTQVLKCLITGAGGRGASAPEMIVYEHVLFGEMLISNMLLTMAKTIYLSIHGEVNWLQLYVHSSSTNIFLPTECGTEFHRSTDTDAERSIHVTHGPLTPIILSTLLAQCQLDSCQCKASEQFVLSSDHLVTGLRRGQEDGEEMC